MMLCTALTGLVLLLSIAPTIFYAPPKPIFKSWFGLYILRLMLETLRAKSIDGF